MNLLIINRDLPFFPGGGGGCTREYFINRELSKKHHLTIVTNVYNDFFQEQADRLMREGLELFYYREHATSNEGAPVQERIGIGVRIEREIRYQLGKLRRMMKLFPSEVQFYQLVFRNMRPSLDQALSNRFYDALLVVQSDGACWTSEIAYSGPKILICHDAKADVMRKHAEFAPSWKRKIFLLWEAMRYARFERRKTRQFDQIVVVSEADKRYFEKGRDPQTVTVVENGVDTTHFRPEATPVYPFRIVFTGLMNHPPNEDAVVHFCEEIFPKIVEQIPEAVFYVVGNHPTDKVRSYHDGKRIFVTGYVQDVRPYLASAAVVVVPLRTGGGTRLKILEALAMGKAVVSTVLGAEGLRCRPGKHLLIADDPLTFSRVTCELMRQPEVQQRLGKNGRALVEQEYDWTALAKRMETVLQKVRKDRVKMRIGINCKFMYPGYAGGIEFYMRNLLDQLANSDEAAEYVVFRNQHTKGEFQKYSHSNLRVKVLQDPYTPSTYAAPRPFRFPIRVMRRLRKKLCNYDRMNRRTLMDSGVDLVHCLAGYLDFTTEILPNIVTIMDLQHEYFPDFFSEGQLKGRNYLWPRSAKISKAVIAISNYTKKTIVEKYNVPPDKICVTHLAANPIYFEPADPARLRDIKNKYRLPDRFVFYPAFTWPHKNHVTLLNALPIYAKKYGSKIPLVLAGSHKETKKEILERIESLHLADSVKFLGFVPTEDMPPLYQLSSALVFPSLFEGFGMPVLEAMASGCPVACSNVTSLPEIVGDTAVTFDPTNAEAIADAIYTLLHHEELRNRNVERARVRARMFSWEKTAAQTIHVYKEVYKMMGVSF